MPTCLSYPPARGNGGCMMEDVSSPAVGYIVGRDRGDYEQHQHVTAHQIEIKSIFWILDCE